MSGTIHKTSNRRAHQPPPASHSIVVRKILFLFLAVTGIALGLPISGQRAQAAGVYFNALQENAAFNDLSDGTASGGCAVKLTQAALQ